MNMPAGATSSPRTRLRVLLTGFGPFPGAPFNPTQALVRRLGRLRRPALSDVDLVTHIFPVAYAAVDRDLPRLLTEHRPDALLMFGLASRTRFVRIETRARNGVTALWPDADQARMTRASIMRGCPALSFGPHTARLLRAALRSGVDARMSHDAGTYLCNYLSWRAIEATGLPEGPRLAAFVHVPLVAQDQSSLRMTHQQLVDAGTALLLEMIRLTRAQSPLRHRAADVRCGQLRA